MADQMLLNLDSFLEQFEYVESLLREFTEIWQDRVTLDPNVVTADKFKAWLLELPDDLRREMLEALAQVQELCTDAGRTQLRALCADANIQPDYGSAMPLEVFALMLRLYQPSIFITAYHRVMGHVPDSLANARVPRTPSVRPSSDAHGSGDVLSLPYVNPASEKPAEPPAALPSPAPVAPVAPRIAPLAATPPTNADPRPDGVYTRDVVVSGVRFRMDLTKREMEFLAVALTNEQVPITRVWCRATGMLWRSRYADTRTNRNRLSRFLTDLNAKLNAATPAFPFFFTLKRGEKTITRTNDGN